MSVPAKPPETGTTVTVHRAGLIGTGAMVLGLAYAALDDLTTTADGVFPELFFVAGSLPVLVLIWRQIRSTFED
jgi:hypothetical protein